MCAHEDRPDCGIVANPVHTEAVDVIVAELDRLDEAERSIRDSAARILAAVGDDAWSWPVLSYLEQRFGRLVPGVAERRAVVEESPAFRRVVVAMSEVVRG